MVSSNSQWASYPQGVRLDLESINDPETYHAAKAYGQSKLANVLFAQELARRNPGLCAVTCTPIGVVNSHALSQLHVPLCRYAWRATPSPSGSSTSSDADCVCVCVRVRVCALVYPMLCPIHVRRRQLIQPWGRAFGAVPHLRRPGGFPTHPPAVPLGRRHRGPHTALSRHLG